MGAFNLSRLFYQIQTNGLGESFLLPTILNMTLTASLVILFVLAARLALKKAPKIFSYALWAVVLFRLLCPWSIATDFSLMSLFDTPALETTEHTTALEYIPYDVVHTKELEVHLPVPPAINQAVNAALPQEHAALGADPLEGEMGIVSALWLLGVLAMLIYSVVTYFALRWKLVGALVLRENIYLADGIGSPFVMGLIRPKIYLPSALSEQEQGYIILHEQHHISRGDHVIKVLAFFALCIHWFNPLVWVAFILSSKDMEMSCDEAVIKKLGEDIRVDYSASLLRLASGRRIIAGTPLAFGEGDTKSRIKNMLSWKRAKPVVVFLSAVAVVLALVICGTNAVKNDSWIKATPGATSVELECNFDTPIRSYAIYEDIYENGALISSQAILFDYFQGGGGATPRQTTFTLNAQLVNDENGGFTGEITLDSWSARQTRELPKEHYTGVAHIAPEIGDGIQKKQKVATEDNITLITILLSTEPDGAVVVEKHDGSPIESNDTAVIYRLVTSEEGTEQYFTKDDVPVTEGISQPEKDSSVGEEVKEDSPADVAYRAANDIVYHLELAAKVGFRDMSPAKQAEILAEYGDLLDDYTLIARQSTHSKALYIVGQFNGDPAQSPLNGMYGVELSMGEGELFQFLYPEEQSEIVESILAENGKDFPPSAGYRIEESEILWSSDGGSVLIQPRDATLLMNVPFNRYLYTPNGREYIKDAVARGIDVCGHTDTFLYVYRISEQFGEIAERIALTEAEVNAILAEDRVKIMDGLGFSATLHINGQTTYYNERSGIPQTVLDIAVKQCDYRFGDPSMITDTIREARLDCDWLSEPLYANAEDLPRLREILKNAEHGYVGSCGYGAKLSLTFTGGEKLTLFKGCDGCDTIVFGSYGGYFLGDRENTEFWEMFGLDTETKLPLGNVSYGEKKTFSRDGLSLEVTNVLSSRTEKMLAEGIETHEYTVFTCAPGAVITVLDADMLPGEIYEDGKSRPEWGISYAGERERTRITDGTTSVSVTPDLEGVYHLESSLFVLKIEHATIR